MSEFVLYSYFRSSASHRVRITLNLKGIAYEYRPVHLLNDGGQQNAEDYRKLNPSRQVPTLIHQGQTIGQSMAIIDYLDQIQPEPKLFPTNPAQRALVIQACEIINSGSQPLHNLKVLQELEKRFKATMDQKNEWSSLWIKSALEALETLIKPHAGAFCFGDTVTAADCFLIPHLANANRFEVSLMPYPTLSRVKLKCEKLEAFKNAAPNAQPDAPFTA